MSRTFTVELLRSAHFCSDPPFGLVLSGRPITVSPICLRATVGSHFSALIYGARKNRKTNPIPSLFATEKFENKAKQSQFFGFRAVHARTRKP
jgi:hypothetical protein